MPRAARAKGGPCQGRVEGDAGKLFDAITDGGTKASGGRVRIPDGIVIGSHTSKTTGVATIDISKSGQVYR